jgi:hypothetical protein
MRWIVALGAFLGAGLTLPAQAQVATLASPEADQTLACLQRGNRALHYPPDELEARTPGSLRYSLRFTAPDRPPEATLLYRAATDAMVDEVERHLRDFRLPCLTGAPVTAVQEFAFRPRATDPISWTPLRPWAGRDETAQRASCLVTPKEGLEDSGGSSWLSETVNVFVDFSFAAPDAPPATRLAYSSASKGQERDVLDYVARYRMPCLPVGASPGWLRQHFQFRPHGVGKRVFKDAVALTAFLSNVKGARDEGGKNPLRGVEFDFNTMSCPFQVAWTLGRPKLDNQVGQVGRPDPNRTEFLVWLAGLELEMKERTYEQLVGQTLIINVGCGTLKLPS